MAIQSNHDTVSMETQVDLTATDYRYIEQRAGEAGIRLCRARHRADGVMDHATNASVASVVTEAGILMITAGAAIGVGVLVASDASGRAVPSIQYAGEAILGRAREAAGAAGEVITHEYFGAGGAGTD